MKENPTWAAEETASGDDYAKGSSYLLWTTLAAIVLVTAGFAVFLLANHKPPVAEGGVTQVWAHNVHTLTAPMDAAGAETQAEAFNQVLVMANVRIHNQSDQPIVIRQMMTNVTLDDGPRSSFIATATDYDRIFLAYPELAKLKTKTLTRDTVIAPGATLEGMIVSSFHATKEEWDGRKDLSFSIQFNMHPDLEIVPTAPVAVI